MGRIIIALKLTKLQDSGVSEGVEGMKHEIRRITPYYHLRSRFCSFHDRQSCLKKVCQIPYVRAREQQKLLNVQRCHL